MKCVVVLIAFAVWISIVQAQDPVLGPFPLTSTSFPDYTGPAFNFNAYSGYITVDEPGQRNNFYMHFTAVEDPENAPLVFWTNGGPGCSGLLGLFSEHGPFRANADGTLSLADISWNKVANMVYMEQPCGVGFSFQGQDIPGDQYESSDAQAAMDNFNFIEGFLQTFPEYIGRPVWISGESYAGVYLPTLWDVILDHPTSNAFNQFTGAFLGNPVIACEELNARDMVLNNLFWHGMVSQHTYNRWIKAGCQAEPNTAECGLIFTKAFRSVGGVAQQLGTFEFNGTQPALNIDDLYHDFITANGTLQYTLSLLPPESGGQITTPMVDYLNRADVQTSIHAQKPPAGEWSECTPGSVLSYNATGASMIPSYQRLFEERPDVDILVYSGDIDIATVPMFYTTFCLETLNSDIVREWGPWHVNGAAAGYVQTHRDFTYATARGGSHEVPTNIPYPAYYLFERFLKNRNLDGGEVFFPPPPSPQSTEGPVRRHTQADVMWEKDFYGIRDQE
mmetsp:Transcript_19140/g.53721  ORF Transcript_19140/g.53721 Transcript_19140/m.53721 type:complete len:506 (+) Transcript_19140:47-1564(+)